MRFKIPNKQPKNFHASVMYLSGHSKGLSPDRVAWMEARNLHTEDPRTAASIMDATASQNVRCKQHAYHFVLSFDPKDKKGGKVPDEVIKEIASEAIERLGLSEYQALIYAHKDTDHPHIHFLVNRVNPQTGKAYDRHDGGKKLTALCKEIAKERGLNVLNERARIAEKEHVDDFDEIPPPLREGEYWQAKREERVALVELSKKQVSKLKTDAQNHFFNAMSWDDLSSRLGAQGVFLERKGQGLILVKDSGYAKLSQMGKKVRLSDLEKRFGQGFAEYSVQRAKELKEKHIEENQPEGYEDMSPSQQRRAERLKEAQLSVDRKQGSRLHKLEEAEIEFRYWQGIDTSYKYGERKISKLEREKKWLGKLKTSRDKQEYKSRQSFTSYVSTVFRKPDRTLKRWSVLEEKHGIDEARRMIEAKPILLGGFNGSWILGEKSGKRKKAERAFKHLMSRKQRWRNKQLAVGDTIAKIKANHQNLQVAFRDFENIKQRVGSPEELRKIIISKVRRRAKALELCQEELIRASKLEEHRKKHFIHARRSYLSKQKERERERNR